MTEITETRLVSLLDKLRDGPYTPNSDDGWEDEQAQRNCQVLVEAGLAGKTLPLAAVAVDLLADRQPDTVRGIMYAVVSSGCLAPKKRDTRYRKFAAEFGDRCAEVEAIPADVLRTMVEDAILSHIPAHEWERQKQVEQAERDSWREVMAKMKGVTG